MKIVLALLLTGCLGPALYVDPAGDGSGKVISDPVGIECGDTCAMIVNGPITLAAIADDGSRFIEWTGACTGTDCVLELADDARVAARFDRFRHDLSVTRSGPERYARQNPRSIAATIARRVFPTARRSS